MLLCVPKICDCEYRVSVWHDWHLCLFGNVTAQSFFEVVTALDIWRYDIL